MTEVVNIRPMQRDDLDVVNTIIETCVMGWDLPERVIRLSLGSYRYTEHDLDHITAVVAVMPHDEIIGIAAWESASAEDSPGNRKAMLLHGLYIAPRHHGQGIGTRLVNAALKAARKHGMNGLLVRAQSDANGFFQSRGFNKLPVENAGRDYPHRWWLAT